MLPESLVDRLRVQRERLRGLHAEDRRQGVPGVWLPEGLERKWPRAGEPWEWQWFFPSRQLMRDPRTGLRRRHHVLDATFQHMIRQAARQAQLDKRVTVRGQVSVLHTEGGVLNASDQACCARSNRSQVSQATRSSAPLSRRLLTWGQAVL